MSIKTRETELTMLGYDHNSGRVWKNDDDGPIYTDVDFTPAPGTFVTSHETMESHTGRNGRYRPCKHTKWGLSTLRGYSGSPYSFLPIEGGGIPRWWYSVCVPSLAVGANYLNPEELLTDLQISIENGLSDQEWHDRDAWALSRMLPSMTRGLSVINALIEMKDFKFLFKNQGNLGPIKRLQKFLRNLTAPQKRLPVRELSQVVLFKEFAIDPLISDLTRAYNDLSRLDERLHYLEKRANKVLVSHWKSDLDFGTLMGDIASWSIGETFGASGHFARTWLSREHYWVRAPLHVATVKYRYAVEGVAGAARRSKAMLDILGVRKDPSIIWNAIPFTFIVDWFVNVQNFLESFAVDNLQFRVKILDFCSSVKISSEARVSCWHYDDQSGANQIHHPKQLIMEGRAAFYERRVSLPNIHQALNLSGLSGREAFLSAALIGANTKRK